MDGWFVLLGTLGGTCIGAGVSYLSQRRHEAQTQLAATRETRRLVYATFLSAMHALFLEVREARQQAVHSGEDLVLRQLLRSIKSLDGQASLDGVRLVAPDATIDAAVALFQHLRQLDGVGLTRSAVWTRFNNEYRQHRRVFTEAARSDLTGTTPARSS